jgi:hypothetical protein
MTPVCHDAGTPAADKLSAAGLDLLRRRQEPDLADTIFFDGPDAPNQACIAGTVLLRDVGGLSPGDEQVTVTANTGTPGGIIRSNTGAGGQVSVIPALPNGIGLLNPTAYLDNSSVELLHFLSKSPQAERSVPAATITVTADRMADVVGYVTTVNTFTPERDILVSLDGTTLTINLGDYNYGTGEEEVTEFFFISLVKAVSDYC